ncbi:MAG: LytTR family transcriptional regulator DNA-binding domain-containing protein [Streptococcus sp.]
MPIYFLKISQSEIINTKEIDQLYFTTSGSVQINLKNGTITYSSRPGYLKAIKEKLSC